MRASAAASAASYGGSFLEGEAALPFTRCAGGAAETSVGPTAIARANSSSRVVRTRPLLSLRRSGQPIPPRDRLELVQEPLHLRQRPIVPRLLPHLEAPPELCVGRRPPRRLRRNLEVEGREDELRRLRPGLPKLSKRR